MAHGSYGGSFPKKPDKRLGTEHLPCQILSSHAWLEGPKGTMQTGERYISSPQISNKWGLPLASPHRGCPRMAYGLTYGCRNGRNPRCADLESISCQHSRNRTQERNYIDSEESKNALFLIHLDLCTGHTLNILCIFVFWADSTTCAKPSILNK